MDSGSLYEFHDARYEYVSSIADSIDLDFFSEYVFVYQNRFILIYLYCSLEIMSEL